MTLYDGFWLLYFLNYNLSVAVGVGFIALAGVAVEIGVIMPVYLNQALRKREDKLERIGQILTIYDLREVIVEGALLRIQPITMTAIIAGLLPIMLGSGAGSEVMRRIAISMEETVRYTHIDTNSS